MDLSIDNAKSFASEANLIKALTKLSFINDRPLIVRNREGRWTAVFGFDNSGLKKQGGYVGVYADAGFMTID